jgi:hypothetical protein
MLPSQCEHRSMEGSHWHVLLVWVNHPITPQSDVWERDLGCNKFITVRLSQQKKHTRWSFEARTYFGGRTESIVILEGSQAPLACPSVRSSVKVKTLKWSESEAWDRARRSLNFFISVELYCHDLGVCDYRRGLDWWMDSSTTYTRHSEVQTTTALSLISSL